MKQLITDQLIEEYQKEILIRQQRLRFAVLYVEVGRLKEDIKLIQHFITHLQSLRQQEVQNVIDAYETGSANEAIVYSSSDRLSPQHYFNQTFKQP